MRDALARCVTAARRVGGRRRPTGGLDTTEVCEWARAQGIEIKDCVRVLADLVAKFKATGKQGRHVHAHEWL